MDLVWEIPETQDERTLTITGTAVVSDGTTITGSFNVKQAGPHSFDVDTETLRTISIEGGSFTMEYATSAPSVELALTDVPNFIIDFSYTQPTNGVGTFTITYDDNYLGIGRYSHPYLNAYCDGILIGHI